MPTQTQLRPGAYYDSIVLMQLQRGLAALPGVTEAGVQGAGTAAAAALALLSLARRYWCQSVVRQQAMILEFALSSYRQITAGSLSTKCGKIGWLGITLRTVRSASPISVCQPKMETNTYDHHHCPHGRRR